MLVVDACETVNKMPWEHRPRHELKLRGFNKSIIKFYNKSKRKEGFSKEVIEIDLEQ